MTAAKNARTKHSRKKRADTETSIGGGYVFLLLFKL